MGIFADMIFNDFRVVLRIDQNVPIPVAGVDCFHFRADLG